jgi:hypothetical protein
MVLNFEELKLGGMVEKHARAPCNILNFKLSPCSKCRMLYLGNSPASEVYMSTFRNTLSVPSSQAGRRV